MRIGSSPTARQAPGHPHQHLAGRAPKTTHRLPPGQLIATTVQPAGPGQQTAAPPAVLTTSGSGGRPSSRLRLDRNDDERHVGLGEDVAQLLLIPA
jgi:hypothetical protein